MRGPNNHIGFFGFSEYYKAMDINPVKNFSVKEILEARHKRAHSLKFTLTSLEVLEKLPSLELIETIEEFAENKEEAINYGVCKEAMEILFRLSMQLTNDLNEQSIQQKVNTAFVVLRKQIEQIQSILPTARKKLIRHAYVRKITDNIKHLPRELTEHITQHI